MRSSVFILLVSLCAGSGACHETSGNAWVKAASDGEERAPTDTGSPRSRTSDQRAPVRDMRIRTIGAPQSAEADPDSETEPASAAPARGTPLGSYRNTYYSFPVASDYSGAEVPVYDASCKVIASVPQDFHDAVCVQGSGRLASATTISFAKRDCSCARLCPRSQQRICFEALDPSRFPWGRGATGRPVRPLRSLAVDSSVIPLGTPIYIPAYVGLPLPGGGVHDGCFLADDRGMKIVGHQIDVFAGSEQTLREWNKRIPTGRGVDVYADPSCAARGI